MDFADLGKVDRTGTVHGELSVEIDLPPDTNDQLVAGAEYVAGGDIHLAQRGEGRRHLTKEGGSVDRKQSAERAADQQLEIGRSGGGADCEEARLFERFQLGLPLAKAPLIEDVWNSSVQTRRLQPRVLRP